MTSRIAFRLARLEKGAAPAPALYAWQDTGETAEQTIARRFPEGVAPNVRVIPYRWASDPLQASGVE
jgi:hypothetical protein